MITDARLTHTMKSKKCLLQVTCLCEAPNPLQVFRQSLDLTVRSISQSALKSISEQLRLNSAATNKTILGEKSSAEDLILLSPLMSLLTLKSDIFDLFYILLTREATPFDHKNKSEQQHKTGHQQYDKL